MIDNEDENFTPARRENKYTDSKPFATLLDGITLGVVGLLIVVIGMLYMTQINVNMGIDLLQLGIESAVLYGATIAIYLLLRSFAWRKGTITEGWRTAFKGIIKNNDWIVANSLTTKATEYCRDWEEKELAATRERILADAGVTLAEFNEKYQQYTVKEIKTKYTELSEAQFKVIKQAKRIRRLRYNEEYLSVNDKYGRRKSPSGGITTKTMNRLTIARVCISVAFTSLLGVSMALSLATDFSFATVVMCFIKIIIVVVSGVVGMVGGYNMAAVRAVAEMNAKINEQNRFIKWCGVDLPPKESTSTEK